MVCTFTLNCFLSFFYGRPGFLSWNGLANFGVFEDSSYNVWEMPFFALIGALGGLTGALFNYLNSRLAKFRRRFVDFLHKVFNVLPFQLHQEQVPKIL
jgi:chloride channel 7